MKHNYTYLKVVFLILFIGSIGNLAAQGIVRQVFATAGKVDKADIATASYLLSWTMGEPISVTYAGSKKRLTEGFQQGVGFVKDTIGSDSADCSMSNEDLELFEIFYYPNPITENLYLNISPLTQQNHKIEIEIFNYSASLCKKINVENLPYSGKIDFSSLERGVYLLKISLLSKTSRLPKYQKVYKLVKI